MKSTSFYYQPLILNRIWDSHCPMPIHDDLQWPRYVINDE